jgi:hypothetical protein
MKNLSAYSRPARVLFACLFLCSLYVSRWNSLPLIGSQPKVEALSQTTISQWVDIRICSP